jgi:hypothetical protein
VDAGFLSVEDSKMISVCFETHVRVREQNEKGKHGGMVTENLLKVRQTFERMT